MTIKKEKYKAIIFDLDGTLIDSLPYHYKSFLEVLESLEIKFDKKHLLKIIGLPTESIFKYYKEKYKLKESIKFLKNKRRDCYYELINGKDLVFSGVKKTLSRLKHDYKLAIATGSSKTTLSHSIDKEFQKCFDVIVTVDNTLRGKPYPDPLLLASRKLKVKASECLMVGDSQFDALASQRAKINFIGVATGFTNLKDLKKLGAKRVIKSIQELKKIL